MCSRSHGLMESETPQWAGMTQCENASRGGSEVLGWWEGHTYSGDSATPSWRLVGIHQAKNSEDSQAEGNSRYSGPELTVWSRVSVGCVPGVRLEG